MFCGSISQHQGTDACVAERGLSSGVTTKSPLVLQGTSLPCWVSSLHITHYSASVIYRYHAPKRERIVKLTRRRHACVGGRLGMRRILCDETVETNSSPFASPASADHPRRFSRVSSSRFHAPWGDRSRPSQPADAVCVHGRAFPRPVPHATGSSRARLAATGGQNGALDNRQVTLACIHATLCILHTIKKIKKCRTCFCLPICCGPCMSMYRRRRTLTDGVLLALSDPACTALDLWGCGTMLSDKALRRAICGMPYLKVAAVGGGFDHRRCAIR